MPIIGDALTLTDYFILNSDIVVDYLRCFKSDNPDLQYHIYTLFSMGKLFGEGILSSLDLKRLASLMDQLWVTDTKRYYDVSYSLITMGTVGLSHDVQIPKSKARHILAKGIKNRQAKKMILNAPSEEILKIYKNLIWGILEQYGMNNTEFRFKYPAHYDVISSITDDPIVIVQSLMSMNYPEILYKISTQKLMERKGRLAILKQNNAPQTIIDHENKLIKESIYLSDLLRPKTTLPETVRVKMLCEFYTQKQKEVYQSMQSDRPSLHEIT